MKGVRQDLEAVFRAGLSAVHGTHCVVDYLEKNPPGSRTCCVAIGKAASAMMTGALQVLGEQFHSGLLVSRDGHIAPAHLKDSRITCMEAGHPVPDARSLLAGNSLCRFLQQAPAQVHLLFLISGGASSLVEVLPESTDLVQLQQLNQWLLASGLDIVAINHVRQSVSRIKGGRLQEFLQGRGATVLLISDVVGDSPAVIGSGLLCVDVDVQEQDLPGWILEMVDEANHDQVEGVADYADIDHHVIASLDVALQAAALAGSKLDYVTKIMDERLSGEATVMGASLVAQLRESRPGLYLWGGESVVTLPANPGRGGRNQHLALAAACAMVDSDNLVLLSAGTDGTDGSTSVAGAIVDEGTKTRCKVRGFDAADCLGNADAWSCLDASEDVLVTGPTGTNVADIVIGIKRGDEG